MTKHEILTAFKLEMDFFYCRLNAQSKHKNRWMWRGLWDVDEATECRCFPAGVVSRLTWFNFTLSVLNFRLQRYTQNILCHCVSRQKRKSPEPMKCSCCSYVSPLCFIFDITAMCVIVLRAPIIKLQFKNLCLCFDVFLLLELRGKLFS